MQFVTNQLHLLVKYHLLFSQVSNVFYLDIFQLKPLVVYKRISTQSISLSKQQVCHCYTDNQFPFYGCCPLFDLFSQFKIFLNAGTDTEFGQYMLCFLKFGNIPFFMYLRMLKDIFICPQRGHTIFKRIAILIPIKCQFCFQ